MHRGREWIAPKSLWKPQHAVAEPLDRARILRRLRTSHRIEIAENSKRADIHGKPPPCCHFSSAAREGLHHAKEWDCVGNPEVVKELEG